MDAALHIFEKMKRGKVTVIDREGDDQDRVLNIKVEDPSLTLAPITTSRVKKALQDSAKGVREFCILRGWDCVDVESRSTTEGHGGAGGVYSVTARNSASKEIKVIHSDCPVIMATGFKLQGSKGGCVIEGLVDWDDTGRPILKETCDESQKTTGLFVVGPMVKHSVEVGGVNRDQLKKVGDPPPADGPAADDIQRMGTLTCPKLSKLQSSTATREDVIFCFIYKFRCRFGLVAGEIMSRLILDYHTEENGNPAENEEGCKEGVEIDSEGMEKLKAVENMLELYKDKGMLITDLSCAVCGKIDEVGNNEGADDAWLGGEGCT